MMWVPSFLTSDIPNISHLIFRRAYSSSSWRPNPISDLTLRVPTYRRWMEGVSLLLSRGLVGLREVQFNILELFLLS